jgi:hypothetical protein
MDANPLTGENEDTVQRALGLLDQAITILDHEDLMVAAAKVDEARSVVRDAAGGAVRDAAGRAACHSAS